MIMNPVVLESLTDNRLYAFRSNELASSNWWKIEVVKGIGCRM